MGVPFRNSGLETMLPVDLAGASADDGTLTWDLLAPARDAAADRYTQLLADGEAPSSADFPEADYIVALPGSPGLLAFYDLTDTALRLLGIADAAGAYTKLTYDPPVDSLRFPLQVGDPGRRATVARGTLLRRVQSRSRTLLRDRGPRPRQGHPARRRDPRPRARDHPVPHLRHGRLHADLDHGRLSGRVRRFRGQGGLGRGRARACPTQVRLLSVMLPTTCEADAACGSGGVCNDGRCALAGVFSDYAPLEPVCRPNGDGIIDDAELPVRAGLSGVFRLSDPSMSVDVDLAGEPEAGGGRLWRFDADALGADERLEAAMEPDGFWFAPYFADATYVAVLDAASGTNAIFRRTPGELSILGLASNVPDQTLLVFDTPVAAMRFPLKQGDAWTADTRTTGKLEGQDVSIDMHYALSVDAAGHVRLPAGTVPVLRLRLDTRQQVVGAPFALARSTVLFVAECLGAVARVVSGVNEVAPEFTSATEVSRLTVPRCLSSLQCQADAKCEDGRCVGGEERRHPTPTWAWAPTRTRVYPRTRSRTPIRTPARRSATPWATTPSTARSSP